MGKLTLVGPVDDLSIVPLTTPRSYLVQGSLWACLCDCGEVAYYPENVLKRQMVKSCGCIRYAGLQRAFLDSGKKTELADLRRQIDDLVKEFNYHKARRSLHDHEKRIGEGLRKAYSRLKELGYSK